MSAEIIPLRIVRQADGELRISDTDLSEKLGFAEVKLMRQVIRRNKADLCELGLLLQREAKGYGRSERVYWLNRAQAIHAVYRSGTLEASRLAIELTKAFDALLGQVPRTRDLLRLNILSPEVGIWEKRFERPFFVHLHRVLGLKQPERNNHPNCGHFINRFVYGFLFSPLGLDIIREANPKVARLMDDGTAEYHRAFRHHQMLKAEHMPAFEQHIRTLNTLLVLAGSLRHFEDLFNRMFPQSRTQIGFLLNEIQSRSLKEVGP